MIVSRHSSLQFPLAQNNILRIELLHEHQSKITQHLARLLRDGVVRKFKVLGVRHPYNVYLLSQVRDQIIDLPYIRPITQVALQIILQGLETAELYPLRAHNHRDVGPALQ